MFLDNLNWSQIWIFKLQLQIDIKYILSEKEREWQKGMKEERQTVREAGRKKERKKEKLSGFWT